MEQFLHFIALEELLNITNDLVLVWRRDSIDDVQRSESETVKGLVTLWC